METQASNLITREIQLRDISPELKENRQAEFVISTEAEDTYGTVFKLDGWDLKRYEKNPIVLYAHRSWGDDPNNIIGLGEVFREGEALIGRVTFETEEVNPKAETVFRKVQAGTLRMASIGAKPIEGHWGVEEAGEDPNTLYFTRQELLEFSIVPIGSNPDALKRSAQAVQEFKDNLTREIETTAETVDVQTTQENTNEFLTLREAQLIIHKSKIVQ